MLLASKFGQSFAVSVLCVKTDNWEFISNEKFTEAREEQQETREPKEARTEGASDGPLVDGEVVRGSNSTNLAIFRPRAPLGREF
jgi:hypothetical protein